VKFLASPILKFDVVNMDKRSKSRGHTVGEPDSADSLVSAIAGEILAPENLNLIIPVSMFIVPAPPTTRKLVSLQANGHREQLPF
jgi:hypothetical protein